MVPASCHRWSQPDCQGVRVMHAPIHPHLHATLSEVVQPGVARASSLLLSDDGRFLLGIRPPVHERGRVLLRMTGIGGWADGEETFAETAVRESIEETGSSVRLLDLDQTLLVHSPDDIQVTTTGRIEPTTSGAATSPTSSRSRTTRPSRSSPPPA